MRLAVALGPTTIFSAELRTEKAFTRAQKGTARKTRHGVNFDKRGTIVAYFDTGATTTASINKAEVGQPVPQQTGSLESSKQLKFSFGTANIPHPEKIDYGGEDAFFVSPVGGGAIGVADGVGGWQESGINPAGQVSTGGFSTDASMRETEPEESAGSAEGMKKLTPQGALKAAHAGTRLPGSTTACVMRLDRTQNALAAANLGDSGFVILRSGRSVFRSPPLQHFFDCPLQFAACPDYTSATDLPEDAALYDIPLQIGDVIVTGTDGLWDNVPLEEVTDIVVAAADNMTQAARQLAHVASEHAHDRKYPSPYSQEARKQGIDIPWVMRFLTSSFTDGKFKLGHMKGGKVDDITVVTALVQEEAQPQSIAQGPNGGAR